MIRIMTVMENRPGGNRGLAAEHGLSFLVDADGKRILFDCGAGENTRKNCRRLNVELSSVDILAFSHSHYDHAAGFPDMAESGLCADVFIGDGFFQEKYAAEGTACTYLGCGFGEDFLKEHSRSLTVNRRSVSLTEHCTLETGFPRKYSFEQIPPRFVKWDGRTMVPDGFEDEQCLVLETERELAVVAGCSHPGILNMLTEIRERRKKPVTAVLGGTHLAEADEERVRRTIEEMKRLGVKRIGMNHCSGTSAEERLRRDEEVEYTRLPVGACVFLE